MNHETGKAAYEAVRACVDAVAEECDRRVVLSLYDAGDVIHRPALIPAPDGWPVQIRTDGGFLIPRFLLSPDPDQWPKQLEHLAFALTMQLKARDKKRIVTLNGNGHT